MSSFKIAPSILSADFSYLASAIQEAEAAGAEFIHVDVMDGQFVPNITIGPPVLKSIRKVTRLTLDVHLMIVQPERYLDDFAAAGADRITVHYEATSHVHRAVQQIHKLGKLAGVALNPSTPVLAVEDLMGDLDLLLVMSVNPGFGGQAFIPRSLEKLERCYAMIATHGRPMELEVDGGVGPENAEALVAAGATVLVAGSAVYDAPEGVDAAIAAIRTAGGRGARSFEARLARLAE